MFRFSKVMLFLGTAATLPLTFATTIVPGALPVAPDQFTTTAFTQVATTGMQTVTTTFSPTFIATYTETVVMDANNVFCAGCLDFLIGVVTDSSSASGIIERVTAGSFGAFSADVGYNTTNSNGTEVVPATVDRSTNGNVIGFNFFPTAINPGQSSVFLEIQTNARSFTTGTVSIQDGVSNTGPGFAPTSVPEPGTMFSIGAGLLAVGCFGLRRRKA